MRLPLNVNYTVRIQKPKESGAAPESPSLLAAATEITDGDPEYEVSSSIIVITSTVPRVSRAAGRRRMVRLCFRHHFAWAVR